MEFVFGFIIVVFFLGAMVGGLTGYTGEQK